MNKIQKVSRFFRVLFQIGFVITVIAPILLWFLMPHITHVANIAIDVRLSALPKAVHIVHPITWFDRTMGFLIDLIPMITTLGVITCLIRLFRLFERSIVFTQENVKYIKWVGYWLLIKEATVPFYQALMSFALTWHNPAGQQIIAISYKDANFGIILLALIVILVSWIMREATKINEENQGFV